MSLRRIVLGTRGSGLALRQTNEVLEQLRAIHPEADFQVTTIATVGDVRPDEPIASLGIGAFVTELEAALLRSDIDVAVHSLKDLPTAPTPGLHIPAVTVREDPRDCLVDRWDLPLEQLPAGARIGTGSPRRASQLLHLRPDLRVIPIRGNVDTRLKKARGPDFDGVVL
ncbi:MAG: hydroxymethylbilane synthase, partial [Chloroflexi bacterium]|nr:hydroxymethylbilane synthase [Chloroflexota bacterium]